MTEHVYSLRTTLAPEDVVVRAVQYFSTTKWRSSGQSGRTATFEGMPPIPWVHITLMFLAFAACVLPGIVYYFFVIQKLRRFQNLVVAATPVPGGSEVVINYPSFASSLVTEFTKNMPLLDAPQVNELAT
jgi:hypothetical protein